MPEESIDEVINKATTERKPLSEEEKKEAMEVAREVWKKAMEKAEGRKGSVLLNMEDDVSRKKWEGAISSSKGIDTSHERRSVIIVTSWSKNSTYGRRVDPSTDLIINVVTDRHTLLRGRSEPTRQDVATYYFSPSQVVKESTSIIPQDQRVVDDIFSINDPIDSEWALRKCNRLLKEQGTLESYHPNKKDLEGLLSIVSLAKEIRPSTAKIVPWPK